MIDYKDFFDNHFDFDYTFNTTLKALVVRGG